MNSSKSDEPIDPDDPLGLCLPPTPEQLVWLEYQAQVAKKWQESFAVANPSWYQRFVDNPEHWKYASGGLVRYPGVPEPNKCVACGVYEAVCQCDRQAQREPGT